VAKTNIDSLIESELRKHLLFKAV